ncbi:P-loop containing nucleoside triphosphate hydrolase protein, partial [Trichophaea hybrida]
GPRHNNDKSSIEGITILPTTSEIHANRTEYLPLMDKEFPHHEGEIHRLLDTQFRLLREDTVGQLRDAIRDFLTTGRGNNPTAKQKCQKQIGSQMSILDSVEVVEVRYKGQRMVIDVSFAQPDNVSRMSKYQRVNWWKESKNLEAGNLVALVDARLETTYLLVEDRERIMTFSRQSTVGTTVLVHVPGMLYASFEPFLRRLKSLHKRPVLPFKKWISPVAGTHYATKNGWVDVPPPLYLRAVDIDLSCITTNRYPLILSVKRPLTVEQLEQHTSLDRGQCEGFIMSLMHELALVQGPPGTGKSYVGNQLVQVLLANRDKLKIGPIICVCYTNHALDQFLEKVLDSGETKIVRLGYSSKSERIRAFQLSGGGTQAKVTPSERKKLQELDRRRLAQAHVIGATTTGLVANIWRLRSLNPKVLLCEEAGEVLEAHLITALLPSTEHAILIGDHEQLRPHISKHELSVESGKHSLDVSLFERLVNENFNGAKMQIAKLKTQRRMHPLISSLVRGTLYPELQDDPTMYKYPEVAGMRRRMSWLDHQNRENASGSMQTSKSNEYEAEMVLSLVRHLSQQGNYSGRDDIAVITPYLGQRQKLWGMLGKECDIIDEDRDETGMTFLKRQPVRVATVDSFQGEEAKIIIVSLVRSNNEHRSGFLKTTNRINVLLSRARHGMYIIGDSKTARGVPMWANVIRMFEEKGNIARTLELQCPRHPDMLMHVNSPGDFERLAPLGGCSKRCSNHL